MPSPSAVYLPFPFSGNPVSSQYLDTLLSYWLGLSLVPLSVLSIASRQWRVVWGEEQRRATGLLYLEEL